MKSYGCGPIPHLRFGRLNVVAGATDASRAMFLTLCCKAELLTAIQPHSSFPDLENLAA
jgi:hypothetical protein